MDALLALFVVVASLALLGSAALRWGVDSRPVGDDRFPADHVGLA